MRDLQLAKRRYEADPGNDLLFESYASLLRRYGFPDEAESLAEERLDRQRLIDIRQQLAPLARTASYPDAGEYAAQLIVGTLDPEDMHEYFDLTRGMYNYPSDAEGRMIMLDHILGTHGVEAHFDERSSVTVPVFSYLNAGDPYALTVVRFSDWGEYRITTFADALAGSEQEYEYQEGDEVLEEDEYSPRPGDLTMEEYEEWRRGES